MTDTAPTGADNTINLQFVGGDLQTHVFTLADFGFTDADGDNLSGVVLTTLPFHSTSTLTGLYYNSVSALQGATISAADITDGKLVYYFQSSASADDSFTFQVVDDSGLPNNTDQTARVMDLHPRAHVQFDVSNDFAYGKGDTLHFLAGLTLSDASDTQLSTVTITSTGATSNITFDQSVLASLGINYDDNGNEIVLSANQVDLASWQSALQTLAFNNPGPFDTRTPDTITFDVQDSLGMSTTANIEIDYQSEISVSATSRTGNIANPSPLTAGKVVNITLDASALITNGQTLSILGTPTLKLSDNGIATYNKALSNLAFGQIVFSYTVKAGENTSNLTIQDYLFSTTNAIKISDGTVLAAGDLPYHPALNYHTVDTLAPTLHVDDGDDISHTIQPGDKLKIGDTVYIRVEASEDLKVTGTPTLKLSNGATATYVSPTSASGSGLYTGQDQLYFAYTVAAGQDTADLKVSSIAGTLTDVAGNAANLKLTGSTDLQAAVDAKAPTVTKVVVTDADNPGHVVKGTIGADRHLTITITMSEPIKYTQTPDIEINLSGHPVFDAAHSTDTVLVFNYTTSQNMNYESFLQTSSVHYGGPVTDNAGNAVTIPKNIDLRFKVDSLGPQFSATVSAKSGVLGS